MSDNAIDDDIGRVFDAMAPDSIWMLFARNNQLTGSPSVDIDWQKHFFRTMVVFPEGQSLDLCNNRLTLSPGLDFEAINEVHRGQDIRECQNRQGQLIGPSISGSWFYPPTAGEGFTQMLLENDSVLTYWFSYPDGSNFYSGSWWVSVGKVHSDSIRFDTMLSTRGRFNGGGSIQRLSGALPRLIIDQFEMDTLEMHMDYWRPPVTCSLMCPTSHIPASVDLQRLTNLAGTNCSNQQPHQWISGAWTSANASGEGFMVEVIENGEGLIYWFTYEANDPRRRQTWMIGQGQFQGQTLHIPNLIQPTGGRSWSTSNPENVELEHWGELTIEFFDDFSGEVRYVSNDPLFGSGTFPIARLARPMLAECD
ncbi:MAG: hypothetical protein AAGJ52_13690 [Pseudomonadota bacterium]